MGESPTHHKTDVTVHDVIVQLELWVKIYKEDLEEARKKRKTKKKAEVDEEEMAEAKRVPKWFDKYIQYRFNLLDRTGA